MAAHGNTPQNGSQSRSNPSENDCNKPSGSKFSSEGYGRVFVEPRVHYTVCCLRPHTHIRPSFVPLHGCAWRYSRRSHHTSCVTLRDHQLSSSSSSLLRVTNLGCFWPLTWLRMATRHIPKNISWLCCVPSLGALVSQLVSKMRKVSKAK